MRGYMNPRKQQTLRRGAHIAYYGFHADFTSVSLDSTGFSIVMGVAQ